MNLRFVFSLPWRGQRQQQPWIMALVALAMWSAAAFVLHRAATPWPAGWLDAAQVLALWLALMGVLLGSMIRWALEARRLCLPGLERAIALSLGLNALVLLAVTAIPLAVLSGHPAPLTEVLAIGLAAGFAYAVLPLWAVVLALILMPLLQSLAAARHWRVFAPQDPRFIEVCVAIVVPLVLLSAWNWRRVLRHAHGTVGWFARPLFLFPTWTGQCGLLSAVRAGAAAPGQSSLRVPQWLQPPAVLRQAGPTDPLRALRVALGGPYLPLTRASVLGRVGLLAGAIGVLALIYLSTLAYYGKLSEPLRVLMVLVPLFGVGFVLMLGTLMRATHLLRRWHLPGGELAVLALLPRFGGPSEQAARLQRVLVGGIWLRQLPLIGAAVLIEALLTHDPNRALLLALALGLAPAGEAAVVLSVLGRAAVPSWGYVLMTSLGQGALIAGLTVVTFPGGSAPDGLRHAVLAVTMLCYFGFATLYGFARRARRRLRHPFLGLC
jgi:hypothetical protein